MADGADIDTFALTGQGLKAPVCTAFGYAPSGRDIRQISSDSAQRANGEHSDAAQTGAFSPCLIRTHIYFATVALVAPVDMPPSIRRVCPVMYPLASDARKTTAPSRS
jgi:hypothetical protein